MGNVGKLSKLIHKFRKRIREEEEKNEQTNKFTRKKHHNIAVIYEFQRDSFHFGNTCERETGRTVRNTETLQ